MVTDSPLPCKSIAREEEIIPFPSEEVTPPVINMYLVDDNDAAFSLLIIPPA
jgi:hypothetical protein